MFANPHNEEIEEYPEEGESVPEMPAHLVVKIDELTPHSRKVFTRIKILELKEPQTVGGRDGDDSRTVTEARVGDETGTVLMTIWEEELGDVDEGNTFELHNGYVGLMRGHLRLYIGRYGKLYPSEDPLEEINTELDLSELEYRDSSDRRDGGRGGFRGGGRGRPQGRDSRGRGGGGRGRPQGRDSRGGRPQGRDNRDRRR